MRRGKLIGVLGVVIGAGILLGACSTMAGEAVTMTLKPINTTVSVPDTSTVVAASTKTPMPTITPTITPTFVYPPDATLIVNNDYENLEISPDRKWKLTHTNGNYHPITLVSLVDNRTIQETFSEPVKASDWLVKWFPDNLGFITEDNPGDDCGECVSRRINVYSINTTKNTLDHFSLVLPEGSFFMDMEVSVSPDGTKFAIGVNEKEIYILDRHANLVYKIKPALSKSTKIFGDGNLWSKYGLFFITRDDSTKFWDVKVIMVDTSSPDYKEKTLLTGYGYFRIISFDPFSPRLIIETPLYPEQVSSNSVSPQYDDHPLLEESWRIFNLQTQKFEKTVLIANQFTDSLENNDSSVVIIGTYTYTNNLSRLLYFYWKTQKLVELKKDVGLPVYWDADLQAFIIHHEDEARHEWLEAVKP